MPNKQIYKKQLMQLGAIMALTGCTSVADMVGYDTASLNEAAAKTIRKWYSKRSRNAFWTTLPTLRAVSKPYSSA